ncbi:MAG: hypothetical protein OEM02_08295 [Desulfobulbaceae bacterium]|nr:hypothetical protein [Desulfobulbaceae bacterium]
MLIKILTRIQSNNSRIFNSILLLILAGGLAYSFFLGDTLRFPDEKHYHLLASNLANGMGYTFDGIKPSAWRTPGYPIFLAFFIKLGCSIPLLRFLNFLALGGCLVLIRSILQLKRHSKGTPISAFLILAYPVLFYTAGTLYPQTIFTFFLVLLLRIIISPKYSYGHGAIFGFVSGILIMLHPTAIFIPPLMYLWKWFPNNWKIGLPALVSVFFLSLVFAPWVYRNYQVFHAFVPLSLHGGDTLYWGNNPKTDIDAWYKSITKDIEEETIGMTEVEENQHYRDLAIKFWVDHPKDAIKLYLKKLIHHFNHQNKFKVQSEFNIFKSLIMFITYYPLLALFTLRILISFKIPLGRTEILLVALYLASALFHAIFLTRIRFRLPYDVLLITHIGIMFSLLTKRMKIQYTPEHE